MKKIKIFENLKNKISNYKEKIKKPEKIDETKDKEDEEDIVINMKKVSINAKRNKRKRNIKKIKESNSKGHKPSKVFLLFLFILTILIFIICKILFETLIAAGFTFLFIVIMLFTQILDNTGKGSKLRKTIKVLTLFIIIFGIIGILAFALFFVYIAVKAPKLDVEKLERSETSLIYDNKNELVTSLGTEKREKVTYNELPEILIDAIVATEDSRFFQHNGFDAPRFLKAAFGQVLGKNSGGASTLTMQVSKNSLTNTDTTITRKFTDIYLSIFQLEKTFTKQEIIEYYVNIPYLGNYSYGVEQAAQSYFGKNAKELNLSEAALIAGLFQAPGEYDPTVNPESAYERRETVLNLMVRHGYITREEADIANAISIESLIVNSSTITSEFQGYIDTVVIEAMKKTNGLDPYFYPMIIYTNMDRTKQIALNKVFNGETYSWPKKDSQAGVAAIETNTGKVIALGAGKDRTGERVLSYATDINKQIGSTAKPLFDYGPGIEYNNWSTYTIFKDEKYSYTGGGVMSNYDFLYKGNLTLRESLRDSRNVPALKAFQQVENKLIYEFVTTLGIKPEVSEGSTYLHEAHSIGAFNGSNPLTMAAAYAAFSNGGYYYEPYTINKIVLRDTGEEFEYSSDKVRAMSDSTAYMITDVLRMVASDIGVRSAIGTDVATKTGSTNYDVATQKAFGYPSNASPDGWIVGYTPTIAMAMWTGYDENVAGRYFTNSQMASHRNNLYKACAKAVFDKNGGSFKQPSSVVSVSIEKGTNPGLLPSENTPNNMKITELFKRGTEPTDISNAYITLENVTGLTYNYADGKLTLSWNEVTMPTLNEGEKDKFGNFGYKVYKDNTLLGFVKDTSYTFETDNPYATYTIYTTFEKINTNASPGEPITFSADVTFTYLGTTKQIVKLGSSYEDNNPPIFIKANSNGTDVTSESTITTKIVDSSNNVVNTIDTSAVNTYTVTYTIKYKNVLKEFTKIIEIIE